MNAEEFIPHQKGFTDFIVNAILTTCPSDWVDGFSGGSDVWFVQLKENAAQFSWKNPNYFLRLALEEFNNDNNINLDMSSRVPYECFKKALGRKAIKDYKRSFLLGESEKTTTLRKEELHRIEGELTRLSNRRDELVNLLQ